MNVPAKFFTLTKWWFIKTRCFVLILLTFTFLKANAQVLQTKRFEVPIGNNEGKFEIITAGSNGLFLQRRFLGSKNDLIQLIRLDTAFQEKWSGFLNIDRNFLLMGKRSFQNKLYLLLRYKDYSKNDLELIVVDEEDGKYVTHFIKGFIPFAPTDFQLTEKAALIGGYYNRIPVVLHFSFVTKKSKVLPGLFNESGELTQIRTYPDGTIDVLISARNFQKQRTIWIKNYDPEGNLLRNLPIETEDNKNLIFGRSLKIDNNMQIVAGVYGNRTAEYSRGIFIASIDPSGMQQVRYYNFADLENFFKYMKARREQRVKQRIERKKIKGKKIRFNYRFLVHELIPYNNHFILLGEAFYPKYINSDRSYYTGFFMPYVNPNSVIQNGRVFDGYYYTHAVVMCFDQQGNITWDNSFEINDVKTFTLEQFVKLEVHPDKIALLYLFDNEIRTKIIKGDQVLEGKTTDPISTLNQNDVVKKESRIESKLEYWYNDFLYAYGIQEILGKTENGYGKRRVFFINKLTYAK